jgi:acetyl-CoA carboxylase biotin carboxyl carrier protein
MDYKSIINLMKEMNRTDLTKLEIEEEGFKICMEKAAEVVTVTHSSEPTFSPVFSAPPMMPMQSYLPTQPVQNGPINQTSEQAVKTLVEESVQQSEETNYKKIVSPMVGTYYASPSPDKPVFIKVGDKVKKGQTVCIIEAMKLMNEIESEVDGEIVKILVNNEEMVEFGQPLFLVK